MRSSSLRPVIRAVGRLIASERRSYAWTSLFWILWNAWPLVPGLLVRLFFDRLAGPTPSRGFEALVVLIVASGLARAAWMAGAALQGVPMRFRMRSRLQANLFHHVLGKPGARAVPGPVGETLSTFRDDADQAELAAHWPYDGTAGAIFAAGGLAILLSVDARVTVLVFLPVLAVIALASRVKGRLARAREASRRATARLTGALWDVLSSVETVQACDTQKGIVTWIGELGEARRRAMVRDASLNAFSDALFSETASLGAGIVLLLAASDMRRGAFTVGDFALFATYLIQVADFTGFLGYLLGSLRESGVSFRRLAALAGTGEEDLAGRPADVPGVEVRERLEKLEVRDLVVGGGDRRTKETVSFSVSRGHLTVIAGPVGSGKTTLLRTLLGLLPWEGGEILWNGAPVSDPARHMRPPRVAYVPQVPKVVSATWEENIVLDRMIDRTVLQEAVRKSALKEDLDASPQGLATPVGRMGISLSGGQVQRTALARALVSDPELLILDDPTSALDARTEGEVLAALLAGGYALVIASSSPRLLDLADDILSLRPDEPG